MPQEIFTHSFPNGLTLVAEAMPWLESAAFSLLLPAGCAREDEERLGLANLTCELAQRGAGPRDSRRLIEDLELLGAEGSASVSISHTTFSAALPADRLLECLAIHADIVRRPHLPAEQFDDSRQSCLQEVYSLADDYPQQLMHELRQHRYPAPFGRQRSGTEETLLAATVEDVRQFFASSYAPAEAILCVAGNFDWEALCDEAARLFGDWRGQAAAIAQRPPRAGRYTHLQRETSQTHIGLACPAVPYAHPDYYLVRGAVGVLSDGMSSRLFTEVREKRGLCYSVYASCHSLRTMGSVIGYAGTTTERAQETLDVFVGELWRLADGVQDEELRRLKARIKSALIMQQESSMSRAGQLGADWYHLGRVRTLDEISRLIDELTADRINGYLAEHPPADLIVVTLGEKPLEADRAVSAT